MRKPGRKTLASALATAMIVGTMASGAVAQQPIPDSAVPFAGTPRGMAIGSDGTLYVADSSGTTVQVFDPGSKTPNTAKEFTGLKRPRAVALDDAGNIYIADTLDNAVKVYSIAGSHTTPTRTLTGVTTPFGVGVDSTGKVYASNGLLSTVAVYDPNATTPNSSPLTGLTQAGAIAVDKNDNVYVADSGAGVKVFDSGDTTPDPALTKTGLTDPQGMAVNSLGQLYVADQHNSKVFVYNPGQTVADDNLSLTGVFGPLGFAIADDDSSRVGGLYQTSDYAIYSFAAPAPPVPPTFECTNAPQLYNVPTWTNQLNVTLKGAQGGGAAGGFGGNATGTLAVTPGSQIQVNVGCRGGDTSSGKGGFNGGANAGAAGPSKNKHLGAFTGGGGATDLRTGDCATTLNCGVGDRIFVAGGGGGSETRGTSTRSGGSGGAPAGTAGAKDAGVGVGSAGSGGTQTAGGAGGSTATGSAGKKGNAGTAGAGGAGGASSTLTQSGPGAGGGGGLFGGGGGGSGSIDLDLGAGIGGAGGGGSSGVTARGASIVSAVSYANGANAGGGTVTITPVSAPLSISTQSLADGAPGVDYEQQLRAKGGVPGYTWTLDSGTLPTGLSLLPGGEISGTPTATGTSSFTVKVTDQIGNTATQPLSILIDTGIAITTPSLPIGSVGVGYSKTLTSEGGGGATNWQIDSGSLPPGLNLNASTGVISGTPTAAGEYQFVVEVTAADASDAVAPFFLDVNPALEITSASARPGGTVGKHYNSDLNAAGGVSPYSWQVTAGSLPAGLSINAGTGTISGVPTKAGTSAFTVTTTDYLGTQVSKQFSIAVAKANICKLNVTARAANKKLPRRGTTTVVKRAKVAKNCTLKIKVIASKGNRGDVRLVNTSINQKTGKVRVQTLGIRGVRVQVKITGVVKKKPSQKSTWNRTWATK